MIQRQRKTLQKIDEWTHRCGDSLRINGGYRYQIEYRVAVHYQLTQGRKGSWNESDGYSPEEPPEIWIQAVELLEVVLYCPPSYQTGVTLDERDENWKSFAMEARNWLKSEIVKAGDFEEWLLTRGE